MARQPEDLIHSDTKTVSVLNIGAWRDIVIGRWATSSEITLDIEDNAAHTKLGVYLQPLRARALAAELVRFAEMVEKS